MWFNKLRGVSEYDKKVAQEREFRAKVVERVNAIPPKNWQKTVIDSRNVEYQANSSSGANIVVYRHNKGPDTYYDLSVDGVSVFFYVSSFDCDGAHSSVGQKQAMEIYESVKKAVDAWELTHSRPELEARAIEEEKRFAKEAAEAEKNRQSILRRL